MSERADILENREPLMGVRHSVFDRYRDSTLRLLYRWAIIIAYVGLMAPLVIVIVASFSKKRFFDFPPSLDSLGVLSYTQLIQHAELKRSLLLSVELAVTTMVVTMVISALAAYAIDRFRFPGRTQVELVLMAPLILPPSVLAIAVLVFISTVKIDPSFWILAGAHVLITIPFALRVMLAALAGFDRSMEEASASLGARPLQTIRRVTIPMLQPGFLAAGIFAFVISFGNVTVSVFLSSAGSGTPAPVAMFAASEYSYEVTITALAVVMMVVAFSVIGVVERVTGLERVF